MCMADDLSDYLPLGDLVRRARKAHDCDECGRRIARGERYRYQTGINGSEYWCVNKCCAHCRMAQEWLSRECHGYLFEGVLIDLEGHLGELIERGYAARLCRLIVGMRQKWQRFDGQGLMPVPVSEGWGRRRMAA